jgi:uncharacterized membrane protein YczE
MDRTSLPVRLLIVIGGLFPFGAGVVLTRQAGLGLGAWHVLSDGLTRVFPLSFGVANILVGVIVSAVPGGGSVSGQLLGHCST